MRRPDLVPDCGSCAAVCCVATSFEVSEDFALDKEAGARCPYLLRSHRCAIHTELEARGFRGCAVYDCHGAGQRVTQAFAGQPGAEAQRNEAFLVMRVVHELLWLLTEAAKLCPASQVELRAQLAQEVAALDALAQGPMATLLQADLRPHREAARRLARRVGEALGDRHRAARALRRTG